MVSAANGTYELWSMKVNGYSDDVHGDSGDSGVLIEPI